MFQVVTLLGVVFFTSVDCSVVRTENGFVRGIEMETYHGRIIFAFFNIPYSEEINQRRRFEERMDAYAWEGIRDGRGPSISCPQISLSGTVSGMENCLILNVFTPLVRNSSYSNNSYPVVVYIHGGAFSFFASGDIGPRYLLDQNVVLVSINFRMGIPGFASTEDHIIPGNLGLKDQVQALKWVQRNIHNFNGDRNTVTLLGMSSGAACVHAHYFSKWSRGLFHRVFMIGGSISPVWAIAKRPGQMLRRVSRNLGCSMNSSFDLLTCLERLPPHELAQGVRNVRKYNTMPLTPMSIVVDRERYNPFLGEHPYDSLRAGRGANVPILMSNVKLEGLFPGLILSERESILNDIDENWYSESKWLLELDERDVEIASLNYTLKRIRKFYFQDQPINRATHVAFLQMITDRYFLSQATRTLALHARTNHRVYYYVYDYLGALSTARRFTSDPSIYGASHIDDLFFMFNLTDQTTLERNSTDLLMIERMTTMLASFARTGIPSFGSEVLFPPVKTRTSVQGPVRALLIKSPYDMNTIELNNWGNAPFWDSLPIKSPVSYKRSSP